MPSNAFFAIKRINIVELHINFISGMEEIKMRILEGLEPERVFYYFEELCKIPHGSGNLDGISRYLEQFAIDKGLYNIRDKSNNIIIIKEASNGYEETMPIILQGHMDMVAVKKDDCDINLEKDPLRLKVSGDYVYAEGTSLGGDDGIAVAYILAVLEDDSIPHPRIEAVITTDEETGMEGATAIDLSMLKARRMLNIDSEEEGVLLTSCAGGVRIDSHIPVTREEKKGLFLKIETGGLQGGHSGTEINKERGNAIKILGMVLQQICEVIPVQLVSAAGGEKDNAIPRRAEALICISEDCEQKFYDEILKIETDLKNEYASKEKNIFIKVQKENMTEVSVMDRESTAKVLDFLTLFPNGIVAMSADIEGLVETSLNLGVLASSDTELIASCAIRSSIESSKLKVKKQVETLARVFGGHTKAYGDYPGWQFDPDSKLRAQMVDIYKRMFGEDVQVEALHAGLECGIMIAKLPGLDCVSYGPNIYDIQTTEEKLSISSTERMWRYLLEILKQK